MKNSAITVICFAVGSAIGAAVAYFAIKGKYEKAANDDIDEIREYYKSELSKLHDNDTFEEEKPEESCKNDCDDIINKQRYTSNSKERPAYRDYISIVRPEEFGANETYSTTSIYYDAARDILLDSDRTILEDPDDVVGSGAIDHFGEYERDSVFIRNDRLKSYIEILLEE